MPLTAVCAGLAAAAAALACGATGPRLVARRLRPPPGSPRQWALIRDGGSPTRLTAATLFTVLTVLGVATAVGTRRPLLVATAAVLLVGAERLRRLLRRRRATADLRARVVEMCDALAAEMQAGQPASRALQRTAEQFPELAPATGAAALGGDVSTALCSVGARPGAEGLRAIAAAWQVAERSGAGLAGTLDRVAGALRADLQAASEVDASLGPPRATARMLAVLPVFGLLLGTGLGGDPVQVLLTTTVGNLCLAAGCTLAVLGLWWVERLAAGVHA